MAMINQEVDIYLDGELMTIVTDALLPTWGRAITGITDGSFYLGDDGMHVYVGEGNKPLYNETFAHVVAADEVIPGGYYYTEIPVPHKTLVDGTEYQVKGGKCLRGGYCTPSPADGRSWTERDTTSNSDSSKGVLM